MNIQVKNVPLTLHRRLRLCASRRGTTLREVILEAIDCVVSHDEFVEQLRKRPSVAISRSAGTVLDEVRAERLRELPAEVTHRRVEA